jgi:hypothetical protein
VKLPPKRIAKTTGSAIAAASTGSREAGVPIAISAAPTTVAPT